MSVRDFSVQCYENLNELTGIFVCLFCFCFFASMGFGSCMLAFLSCGEKGDPLAVVVCYSLWWLLLLQSPVPGRAHFSSCCSRALEHELSRCGTWA